MAGTRRRTLLSVLLAAFAFVAACTSGPRTVEDSTPPPAWATVRPAWPLTGPHTVIEQSKSHDAPQSRTSSNPKTTQGSTTQPNGTSSTRKHGGSTQVGTGYGDISTRTGRPKTVHVRGYYRKDGTYVRPHYRSKPWRRER